VCVCVCVLAIITIIIIIIMITTMFLKSKFLHSNFVSQYLHFRIEKK